MLALSMPIPPLWIAFLPCFKGKVPFQSLFPIVVLASNIPFFHLEVTSCYPCSLMILCSLLESINYWVYLVSNNSYFHTNFKLHLWILPPNTHTHTHTHKTPMLSTMEQRFFSMFVFPGAPLL